jgi:hypothetical protein
MNATGSPEAPHPRSGGWPGSSFLLAAVGLTVAGGMLFREARTGWNGLTTNGALAMLAATLLLLEAVFQIRTRSRSGLAGAIARGGGEGAAATMLVTAAIMTTMVALFRDHLVDDSFITYRFSRNLARGHGVAWNPGEPPVEGFSNHLWMLAHAVGFRLGADPLLFSRWLGGACYALSAWSVFRLGRALGAEFRHAARAAILFSLVPAFAFWAMSGLETVSVVLFSLLFFHAMATELPVARWPWRTALWGLALVLSRLDGLLVVKVALAVQAWPREPGRWGRLIPCLVLLAPPIAAYQLWRWLTFGTLVPNTVSAKLESFSGQMLVVDFLAYAFPLLLLAALLARARAPGRVERAVLAVAAVYVLAAMNVMPQVAHGHRFFLPVLAPLIALAAPLAREWAAPPRAGGAWAGRLATVLIAAYAIAPLFRLKAHARMEVRSPHEAHMVVGRELHATFAPGDLLAASDCGIMPYLSDMRTLDIWGLTDRVIATQGFSTAYVMGAKPSAIVLHSLDPVTFLGREFYDRELYPIVAADPTYQVVDGRPLAGYTLWVFSTRPLR